MLIELKLTTFILNFILFARCVRVVKFLPDFFCASWQSILSDTCNVYAMLLPPFFSRTLFLPFWAYTIRKDFFKLLNHIKPSYNFGILNSVQCMHGKRQIKSVQKAKPREAAEEKSQRILRVCFVFERDFFSPHFAFRAVEFRMSKDL